MQLTLMRCVMNNKRCVFPNCNQKHNLVHVPKAKRYEVLNTYKIYIPNKSVLCQYHLNNANWNECVSLEFNYTREYIEDIIELLRKPTEKKHESEGLFSSKKIKEKTGLSLESFNEIFENLPTLHRFFPKNTKKAKLALLMYLTRLRKGDSYDRVYKTFNVARNSGFKYICKARIALQADFVPKNLGFEAMSREMLLQSITNTANALYLDSNKDQVVLIADGTYVYVNKTKNFLKQKEFYSGHKFRHLFKPMVLVTTNGRFVEVFGPYKAIDNDATILKQIFETYDNQINGKLEQGKLNNIF